MRPLPASVQSKRGAGLHRQQDHPIGIAKDMVQGFLRTTGRDFTVFDDLDPVVSVEDNFNSLLIPPDHPARSESDTFYVAPDRVLRTHTTAHQVPLLMSGLRNFTVSGEVFRRDEVDRSHYPVFHQMEGVCQATTDDPAAELQELITALLAHLFGDRASRVLPDDFPFTVGSLQAEVLYDGAWLEVLGCGVVHPDICRGTGCAGSLLAWGVGLERLAMLLFRIPDIRLFWSREPAFLQQFSRGRVNAFVPFSSLPPVNRDISFWLPPGQWTGMNFFLELARESAPELVQSVVVLDEFQHPKVDRRSMTFRVTFTPIATMRDSAHLTSEANTAMTALRHAVVDKLQVSLR